MRRPIASDDSSWPTRARCSWMKSGPCRSLQSKLLRVLQTGDVERVGSSKARHVNVRIVSATNANLQQEVAEGRFREDLLFRLNTIELHLPALRDRREDIPALATHFLRRHATRYRKGLSGFDAGAMQLLLGHPWPGNIRELDHAVERAVLLAQAEQVRAGDLGLRRAIARPRRHAWTSCRSRTSRNYSFRKRYRDTTAT